VVDTDRNIRLGIDLITLYDPKFWGIEEFNLFYDNTVLSPDKFWDRALDTVAATGIEGIEITFGPGHWQNAMARYGSAEGFRAALDQRDLTVCSGFYTGLVLGGDWQAEGRADAVVREVADYADFLRATGCDIMVAGLPMRRSWDADPPQFVDIDYASRLADVLNRMGYAALTRGVRLAIHPETHAVFWLRRDIDLFLQLTDPVYVSFCPDTAHLTLGGSDPVALLRAHHNRVIIAHWKDARGTMAVQHPIDENIFKAHHPYFARVGTGVVDWQAWIRTLRDVGYQGWAIIELDAAEDPPATINAAKQFVETTVLPIYS
jgi:sugar phosphate isomerase/epimerase